MFDLSNKNRVDISIFNSIYRYKCAGSYTTRHREYDCFIYYVKGGHAFHFENGNTYSTKSGDFLYLPYGSAYTNKCLEKDTEYFQIDFLLYNNNLPESLFDTPYILSSPESNDFLQPIQELYTLSSNPGELLNFSCMGNLCNLIAMAYTCKRREIQEIYGVNKISKTVSYIKEFYYENTSVKELADISSICISGLEKIFKKNFGMSPVAYRNLVRINQSKVFLLSGLSIKEVSEKVGFSNYYYFCEIFKKTTGMSPGEYVKKHKGT